MKTIGRISFGIVLLAFIAAIWLLVALGPYTPYWINTLAVASTAGLLIWSTVFLKAEPTLARIALVVFTVTFAFIYLWASFHPGD